MRFRLRDILLLTALIAINLAAAKYALRVRTFEEIGGVLIGAVTGSTIYLIIALGASWFRARHVSKQVDNTIIELSLPFPWGMLFTISSVVLLAGCLTKLHVILFGVYCGTSAVFWTQFILSLSCNKVKVSCEGVLFRSILIDWRNVYPLRTADGTITSLRLHNPWFGSRIAIPLPLLSQVETLLQARK